METNIKAVIVHGHCKHHYNELTCKDISCKWGYTQLHE
jgi:hypothetical protein